MIVYLVGNTVNGKRYVGITTKTLEERWRQHCWLAENDGCQAVYRAMRRYGIKAFEIQQIDKANSLEELLEKERFYINAFATFTTTGHGYNMTLGGDGVFGFQQSKETRAQMTSAAEARFSDASEREKQRQRQAAFWDNEQRAEAALRTLNAHKNKPELARQHSEFMKRFSNPEQMSKRAKLFWDAPGARERFTDSQAAYWSDPKNRARRSQEIRARFASNPEYAKKVSEGKKKYFRENPDAGQQHSKLMKRRFRDKPELLDKLSEQTKRCYEKDPTLLGRMAVARRATWVRNSEGREKAAKGARTRATARALLRARLEELAAMYRTTTGAEFPVPSRAAGGWRTEVMSELIRQLEGLLAGLP